ncbi:ABC transporter permease [Streptomyces reniochalinae]|uniref:ABC transporter permease n=1 Tax=Streptomyces reniochalinae TaxID=2250578 RepID=A0A367E9A2_9ACTN|nr:ABC transporter permease [Streptomyces reniochalinae]RCG14591.1 ABC transporter permease [Streptomyces reniochalinae]
MSTVETGRTRANGPHGAPGDEAGTSEAARAAHPGAGPRTSGGAGTRGQFAPLAKGMTKELVRDPMALFFSVVFPVLLAGLFVAIMQLTWAGGPYKIAVVGSGSQATQLADALGDGSKVTALDSPRGAPEGMDAVVAPTADGDTLRVLTDPESPSVVTALRDALPQTGWEGRGIDALGTDGTPPFEPMPFVVPGVLVFALMSLALTATAGTLVSLRANGTLRLLRTTPARPQAILTSLLPARGALGLALLAVAGVAATALGLLTPLSGLTMLLTTALGMWLLMSVGFLLGGTLRSPELTNAISGLLTPLLLMGSGVLFPLELMPDGLADVLSWNPVALLGDALRHDVTGGVTRHAQWLDWLLIAATAAVLTFAAVRAFRWDTEKKN